MGMEQLAEKLTVWIRSMVSKAGCKGVVIGMSGGIDSSVLAILCQHAFPENILGLIMPCHSNPEDEKDAKILAAKFSIPTKTVVLDNVFDTMHKVLANDVNELTLNQIATANLKVRLRMITLYYYANQRKYIVAGASNKSEISIGYFTKYGDGGVDILPLGSLVKKEIRKLASVLGVPQHIIDKPPSAGLWQGQTDEDDLGFSYEKLDHYLLTGEASDNLKTKINSMIATHKHKRIPPPIAEL
ncbi:MAG: NAD(+) synthase [Dehalococcoidales bacterium]|nr:NAD(+) synthase [Dehalococcoidales bacterium]